MLLRGSDGSALVVMAADRLRGASALIITSTVGGNALGLQNYQFAAITFAATTVIAGIGLVIYRQVCRRHKRSAEDDRPEKNT